MNNNSKSYIFWMACRLQVTKLTWHIQIDSKLSNNPEDHCPNSHSVSLFPSPNKWSSCLIILFPVLLKKNYVHGLENVVWTRDVPTNVIKEGMTCHDKTLAGSREKKKALIPNIPSSQSFKTSAVAESTTTNYQHIGYFGHVSIEFYFLFFNALRISIARPKHSQSLDVGTLIYM